MPRKLNSIEKFWKELKKRKTGKVIVTYAATAFILLQLADILAPALSLPDWTTTLVIFLLALGFPIAFIFSWIFDITPEGITRTEAATEPETKEPATKPPKKLITEGSLVITILLVVVVILAYPKIFKKDTIERLRSSGEKITVAVMPFQNMTNDTTWNIWQQVIQDNINTFLSENPEDIKVRQPELINTVLQNKDSYNSNSFANSFANSIAKKLDADLFINGSINLSGSTLRLNAQIVDTKTGDALKSFQIDGQAGDKLVLIDSLKVMLCNVLIISKLGIGISPDIQRVTSVTSPEAFRYFIEGQNAFNERNWQLAERSYSQAIGADSGFTYAYVMLSNAFLNQGLYDKAKKCAQIVNGKKDKMPHQQKLVAEWISSVCFGKPVESLSYAKKLLEIDDQSPNYHFIVGIAYLDLGQYDKAIPEYEKAIEIYDKCGIKPSYTGICSHLIPVYRKTGQYKKEKDLFKRMERDFPGNLELLEGEAIMALTEGDTQNAARFIEKLRPVTRELSWSEAKTLTYLATIYEEAGIPDKSEAYYRLALSTEPDNTARINNLARFLFDNNRSMKEGFVLIEKALAISPADYKLLDTKGWGLYKQGRFPEALAILQKSWDLRLRDAIYNHEAFLHLEAAKKAAGVL
jgi:tetratricopeptide (TPR) repeat protein